MTLLLLDEMSLTIGHKPDADPYPKWNGVWAVLKWHDLGATAFDCDVQISADGTPWAIHWPNWWKHGIITKPGEPTVPQVVISQLKDAAVGRLVHRDGWEINTVREVLEAAARLGIVPCLEAKADHRVEAAQVWERIKADALEVGCAVVAMTIQNYPDEAHAMRRLRAAHAVGIPTLLLTRRAISPEWWTVLDGAKGTAAMVGKVPAGKVRLGTSAADATKYGCSCGPTTARAATTKVVSLGGTKPEVPPVVTPLRIDAVDLSHHNTVTADGLSKAKAAGVDAVWHKATEGTTWIDSTFDERRAMCKSLHLPFGAYHFARPGSSGGKAQAVAFLKVAKPQTGDLIPMLDLEDRGGLNQERLTDWAAQFAAEVRSQVGVSPIIYTPFDLDANYGSPLWVARYHNGNAAPRIPSPWTAWTIRQFSNGVYGVPSKVAGLGAVDLNQVEVPIGELMVPAPAPKPPEAPVDDRYERITFRGRTVDRYTAQALQAVEKDLGYELTITQGSYNAGKVSASAGTHDGGGVVDLAPWDWQHKVPALRKRGFAAWRRLPIAGLWPEHIHAVQAGNDRLAPAAARQVDAYKAGRNGLANNGPDDGPRIRLVPFKYEEDDMPYSKQELSDLMEAAAEKAVKKYVGEVVTDTHADGTKEKIWLASAVTRLLAVARRTENQTKETP